MVEILQKSANLDENPRRQQLIKSSILTTDSTHGGVNSEVADFYSLPLPDCKNQTL
jgi:hypothetical protein